MDCVQIRPLLSVFADNETTEAESALIKRHLVTCPSCASELAFSQAMNVAIFTMPQSVAPPDLFESIAAATYARPTFRQRFIQWLAPAPTRWAMGTALAACLTIAIVAPHPGTSLYRPQGNLVVDNNPSKPTSDMQKLADESVTVITNKSVATVNTTDKKTTTSAPSSAGIPANTEQIKNGKEAKPAVSIAVQTAQPALNANRQPTDSRVARAMSKTVTKNAASQPGKAESTLAFTPGSTTKIRPETRLALNTVKVNRNESRPVEFQTEKLVPHHVATVAVAESKSSPERVPATKATETNSHEGATDVRVATAVTVQDPEPAPGRQVVMAETARASRGFRLTLRNAGTNQRQDVNFPSPPNLGPSGASFASDPNRIRLVSDNDKGDRIDTDRVASLK